MKYKAGRVKTMLTALANLKKHTKNIHKTMGSQEGLEVN